MIDTSAVSSVSGTSVPAANSALQRARVTMQEHLPARRSEWSAATPSAEEREKPDRPDAPPRELTKLLWEGKGERALLTSLSDKRRATLLVSRGKFEEEIYRVR